MNAHQQVDQALAREREVERRLLEAAADHRARRRQLGVDHEQLAFNTDTEPPAPGVPATRVVVPNSSSIGERPNQDRARWHAYRKRVLPVLWERQGGLCALCGWPIDLEVSGRRPEGASVDHVVPLQNGGELIPASDQDVRLVHTGCNSGRGNRTRRWRGRAQLLPGRERR